MNRVIMKIKATEIIVLFLEGGGGSVIELSNPFSRTEELEIQPQLQKPPDMNLLQDFVLLKLKEGMKKEQKEGDKSRSFSLVFPSSQNKNRPSWVESQLYCVWRSRTSSAAQLKGPRSLFVNLLS